MSRPPVRRQEALARAERCGAVCASDLRRSFADQRGASRFLHKLYRAGWIIRIGGDGTKESPYLYAAARVSAPSAQFDATGLEWMLRR